ncbi:MAG: glycosyltransferase family 1 protein [Planctomycetes bacterium]|nr:glycosyltransferase family 1 protein [Planctomycetota bacterium]
MTQGPVLFVLDPSTPRFGLLVGSFASTGLAPFELLALDRDEGTDRALFDAARRCSPRLVVLGLGLDAAMFSPRLPRVETLVSLRRELDVPIVATLDDGHTLAAMDLANAYAPAVDLFNVQDDYGTYREAATNASRYWPSWTPLDPRLFGGRAGRRDVDVAVVAGTGTTPDAARESTEQLRRTGATVLTVDDGTTALADACARARIVVHLQPDDAVCGPADFAAPAAGALLLARDNPHVRRWLEPRTDFAPFTDPDEIEAIVQFHLAHGDQHARIAERGQRRVRDECSARLYWRRLLTLARSPAPSADLQPV